MRLAAAIRQRVLPPASDATPAPPLRHLTPATPAPATPAAVRLPPQSCMWWMGCPPSPLWQQSIR